MRFTISAFVFFVAAVAMPASAGRRTSAAVSVNLAGRTASGSLGSARSSSDTQQQIGCGFALYPADPSSPDQPQRQVYCTARNSAGVQAICFSAPQNGENDVVPMIAEDSFIRFTWDANNNCTSLRIENYSYHQPVQP